MKLHRHKYGVAPADERRYRGVLYHSKAEMLRAEYLDFLVTNHAIPYWTRQVPFILGCPENKYVVDFMYLMDGDWYAEDVKGVETKGWLQNRRLWKVYGPMVLRIVRRTGSGWTVDEEIIGSEFA